jgi:hypothetical protein
MLTVKEIQTKNDLDDAPDEGAWIQRRYRPNGDETVSGNRYRTVGGHNGDGTVSCNARE